MQRVETTILSHLLYSEDYLRKVYPFLKAEYFADPVDNKLFTTAAKFIDKYNQNPTKEAIQIALQNDRFVTEEIYESCMEELSEIEPSITTLDWVVDESEAFCKRQSVFNAVSKAISIIDGKDKEFTQEAIPTILQEALSVAFNTDVGHDYWADAGARFDAYSQVDERIPFRLSMLNKVTDGGVTKKSLTCILAPTGGGKSVFLCDWAAFLIESGYNVLYCTAEMAESRIAERVDANILDVSVSKLKHMERPVFVDRLEKMNAKAHGKLIIKEFPTSTCHVGHIRNVLDELEVKKKFKPDIILVDYLNIFVSQRYKSGGNHNSYTIVKSIAEEFRGMAVEYDVPVVTATQVNRGGMKNSDIDMEDTAESSGLIHVLDFFFALIPTEELDAVGQMMIKQLKNRWGDVNNYKRFVIGKLFDKMRLFDVDNPTAGMMQEAKTKATQEEQNPFKGVSSKFGGRDFGGISF